MLDLILVTVCGGIAISSIFSSFYFIAKGMLCKQNQGKYMVTGAILMIISKIFEIMVLK